MNVMEILILIMENAFNHKIEDKKGEKLEKWTYKMILNVSSPNRNDDGGGSG